ncbi:hypothetical protein FEV13_12355 [Stutzerimonas degradans]|nr:hypothetical protein FEV13_12355 [Stutzerimonas degradans]
MAKVCVFCGAEPNGKTKEHVVPRWLIELTGNPKREVFLGFEKNPQAKPRKFAFDQLTFPACDACNNKYASLENSVKPVMKKILDDQDVTVVELNNFLDWLDKVRVGLWLGMIQLDKNYAGIDPNFHIETRISQYDRMLIVEKTNAAKCKLNFGGVDALSFSLTPSAFVLIVNNYYFTNISYMFLLHRRLGYPYPQSMHLESGREQVAVVLAEGRSRVMRPILRKSIKEKGKVIYQPMFRCGLMGAGSVDYKNDYMRVHSMDFESGVGNIFSQRKSDVVEHFLGDKLNLTPDIMQNDSDLFVRSAIHISEWQNWLVQFLPNTDRLSRDERQFVRERFKTGVKINNLLIDRYKSLLEKPIS